MVALVTSGDLLIPGGSRKVLEAWRVILTDFDFVIAQNSLELSCTQICIHIMSELQSSVYLMSMGHHEVFCCLFVVRCCSCRKTQSLFY